MKALTPWPPLPAPALPPRERGDVTAAEVPRDPFSADVGGVHVHFGAGVLARLGEAGARARRHAGVWWSPIRGCAPPATVDRALLALGEAGLDAAVFDRRGGEPDDRPRRGRPRAPPRRSASTCSSASAAAAPWTAPRGSTSCSPTAAAWRTTGAPAARAGPCCRRSACRPPPARGARRSPTPLISQEDTHQKMACGDRKARFRAVLLDPDLAASAPRRVAAAAGIDAVAHAVESVVTTRAQPGLAPALARGLAPARRRSR